MAKILEHDPESNGSWAVIGADERKRLMDFAVLANNPDSPAFTAVSALPYVNKPIEDTYGDTILAAELLKIPNDEVIVPQVQLIRAIAHTSPEEFDRMMLEDIEVDNVEMLGAYGMLKRLRIAEK